MDDDEIVLETFSPRGFASVKKGTDGRIVLRVGTPHFTNSAKLQDQAAIRLAEFIKVQQESQGNE